MLLINISGHCVFHGKPSFAGREAGRDLLRGEFFARVHAEHVQRVGQAGDEFRGLPEGEG